MATSTITVTGLTATPGIGNIGFKWSFTDPHVGGRPYMQLDAVEVHVSTTNNRNAPAVKVAEGRDGAQLMQVVEGTTYYCWIRARDKNTVNGPLYSDWYPSSPTAGVVATVGIGMGLNALIRGKLVASVSGNALTVRVKTLSGDDPSAANPVYINFPSATDGTVTTLAIITAMSVTVPSSATLGSSSGQLPFRLWFMIFNRSGTLSLAVSNRSDRTVIYSLLAFNDAITTSLSSGSGSVGIIYETTGSASAAPYRVIGYMTWETGLTTAGTWNNTPTVIELAGVGVPLPGDTLSSITATNSSVSVGTTDIPFDNTPPLSTEGDSVLTNSIDNLRSHANHFRHDFIVNGSNHNASSLTNSAVLWSTGVTAAPKAVGWDKQAAIDEPLQLVGTHTERDMWQSLVRVGGSANGATSFTMNGINGAGKYGGALESTLTITEIMG